MTQAIELFDKLIPFRKDDSLFPKPAIQVQVLVETPGSIVFELIGIFHSISLGLTQFPTICGGKVGETVLFAKKPVSYNLDLIIGHFSSNIKRVSKKYIGGLGYGEALY